MKKVTCIIASLCFALLFVFGQTDEVSAEQPETSTLLEAEGAVTSAQKALVESEEETAEPKDSTADSAQPVNTAVSEAIQDEPAPVIPAADVSPEDAAAAHSTSASAASPTDAAAEKSSQSRNESIVHDTGSSPAALPTTNVVVGDKDGVQSQHPTAVEMNEPTMRTKAQVLSMHSGIMVSGIAANNIFSITDFFKKELVIDLNKLAKNTIRTGLHGGACVGFDWFFHFTVQETHTIKLSTTIDANAWVNLPKSLIELAAKGNAVNAEGKDISGTFNAKVNVFADTGIMYQLQQPNYGFSARLAYFVPIAYMENPQATYRISPIKNTVGINGLSIKAQGAMALYGHLPAAGFGKELSISDIFKDGGLDLSIAGSYRPKNWVNITAGIDYLPLMVVTMDKGIRADFEFEGALNGILDNALGSLLPSSSAADSKKKSPEIFELKKKTATGPTAEGLPKKKIMRPGKIRIGADFKPLENNYLILSPFLAFPFINATPYYIDGGLKIESRFAKVLGAYWDSSCVERIWRHELGLLLDSRGFSLLFAASISSHDFTRTFHTLSGLGFKFGAGIGF